MDKLTREQPKFYHIGYYSDYFNVGTFDVLDRFRKSIWPFCVKSGIYEDEDHVDLYGPIWIMITLIVEIAIIGYINHHLDATKLEMEL